MQRTKKGRTGYEVITGNRPNISEWIQSNVTKLCGSKIKYYLGLKKESIRWIGIPHGVGQEKVLFLSCKSGKVISKTSLFQPIKR